VCGGSADDAGCGCRKSGEKSHTKRSHNGLQNVAMLKLPKAKLEPVLLQEKMESCSDNSSEESGKLCGSRRNQISST
jgi:hypothetical protein